VRTFSELGVPRRLVDVLASRGVTDPFPIQELTLAEALAGRDLSGRAPTGSGKTLAFAIPLAVLAAQGGPRSPRALVLVPTRELAAQVAEELRPLAAARGRTVGTFYGGTTLSRDQRCIRRGVDIAVACPGRLADLVRRRDCDLSKVNLVVLDEADRMADMGFLPEVTRLLDATSDTRQTLLFSATLDGDVDVLVRRYQRDPVRHELGASAEEQGEVRHLFWSTEPLDRVGLVADVVGRLRRAIVFTRTKHGADRVAKQLVRRGVTAAAIHGDRSQGQRERALADFSHGRVTTLVATDVAARGIHVDDVGVVIHFDVAGTDKDYVHRSGRTGRAGSDGVVVTLAVPEKRKDLLGIQRSLKLPQGVVGADLDHLTGAPPPPPAPTTAAGPAAQRDQSSKPRGGGRSTGRGQRSGGRPEASRGGRRDRSGGGGRPQAGAAGAVRRGPRSHSAS